MPSIISDAAALIAVLVSAYVAWTQRKKPEIDTVGATVALLDPMRRRLEDLDERLQTTEGDNLRLKLELQAKDTLIHSLERQVGTQGKELLNTAIQINRLNEEMESARVRETELVAGVSELCTQLEELGHVPRYRPKGRTK